MIYGLLNVIGTIAVLKFFRYGDLGDPGEADEERALSIALDVLSWVLPGRRADSSASSARSA